MNDPRLLEEVQRAFDSGHPLHRRLPWGRLHLDRPLPFLCLYRRPPDKADEGTERLLLGEAAYLIVTAPEAEPLARELARRILGHARERFGAALLLELWADEAAEAHAGPGFHLHAPRRGAPVRLLETLEADLLGIELRGRRAQVALSYEENIAPPGRPPLLERATLEALGAIPLGLAVRPIYRASDGGALYPFALAHLHRRLTRALRHAFFVFVHEYTPQRPRHVHQLGRRHLPREVLRVDAELAAVSAELDLLLHVTPVNAVEAWEAFRASDYQRAPEFLYRPRTVDPGLLKRRLYAIPLEAVEDPALAHLFLAKRDELDRQLTLYGDRGTPRFLAGSRALFGEVEADLARLAEGLLARLPRRGGGGGAPLPVAEFAARAQAEVDRYRAQDPEFATRVAVRDDVAGILVSRGDFLIGVDARVSEARVEAALAHEIGTHCLTHHNGGKQPLAELRVGMAGYEPLQEGLAVLAEYLVGGLGPNRLRQLAARVLAVQAICQGADFIETFRLLRDRGEGARGAFTTTMRVFRGGGYTKDVVYLRGLKGLLAYLGDGGDLELLYLGKVALEFIDLVEELRWRKVLGGPALRPHHLDHPQAQARLARIRAGMDVYRLAEEIA